jgi:TRAP-type C4-dicarboxylate transport system substrate-binding protein
MEKNGFVLLGIAEGGFARIMSREPMVKLESVRASKVWLPEGDIVVLETYKSLGISPISLPISDVYTGLQTGLIDTISVNPTGAIAFQWHTSTPYLTDTPIIYLIGLFAIQKKAFDKISPADQVIVREVIADVFKALDSLNRADNIQASEALKALGTIFVKPEPQELQRWQTLSALSIDNMVAEGIVSREMVEIIRGHLSTYRSSQ